MKRKKWAILLAPIVMLLLSTCPAKMEAETKRPALTAPVSSEPVMMADANLQAAVREALKKPTGELTSADLAGLTELNARSRGINSLAGIEKCVNLVSLDLGDNALRDLAPLASLAKLKKLNVEKNYLTHLKDIAGVVSLLDLDVSDNQLTDISPLKDLKNLERLDLSKNQIADISPLAGLLKLTFLDLSWNLISDIQPLVKNAEAGGLGQGDTVNLSHNRLPANAGFREIPILRDKGVNLIL
jgi:Leucine-rich repeat (LRR) protein